MPLIKGAKPGTKSFGKNIATEIKAGKPRAQAAAIAYSESDESKNKSSHKGAKEDKKIMKKVVKKGCMK